MESGALNKLFCHSLNEDLAEEVAMIAKGKGYAISHNASSSRYHQFMGFHRWVVLDPKKGVETTFCRSRACIDYTETPYGQYFKPTLKGERACLQWVLRFLRQLPVNL